MDNGDLIETLNNLIETSRDGEEGFRTCAEGVKNPELKQMFEQAASRCRQAVSELQPKVRSLGGDPEKKRLGFRWAAPRLGRNQVNDHRDERSCRSG